MSRTARRTERRAWKFLLFAALALLGIALLASLVQNVHPALFFFAGAALLVALRFPRACGLCGTRDRRSRHRVTLGERTFRACERCAQEAKKRFSPESVRAAAAASRESEKLIQRVGQAVESRDPESKPASRPAPPSSSRPPRRCLGCGTRLEAGKGYCAICGRPSEG